MIQERYVSFEIAKLLKEKGMDKNCFTHYMQQNNNDGTSEAVTTCTHQMAMEWLREKHKLLISIFPMETIVGIETLCYGIWRIAEDLYQPLYCGKVDNLVDSYEAAVEAAILYSLKNLI